MIDIDDRGGFDAAVRAEQADKGDAIDSKPFVCPAVVGNGIHDEAQVIRLKLEPVKLIIGRFDLSADGRGGGRLTERV